MITRSTSSSKSQKRKHVKETSSNSDTDPPEDKIHVEDHLARAQKGVGILLKEVRSLRERNESLTAELKDLRDAASTSNRSSKEELQQQVQMLKSDKRKLERARQKDKEKIEKYKVNELKQEADDLEDRADHDAGEMTHEMRKLLRRFQDLMSMNVLDKDEDCAVCMETMTPKNCSSLPCQHLICNSCLPQICKVDWLIRSDDSEGEGEQGQEVTKCPQCREQSSRKEVQLVHYTATEQWDYLLEVVQGWAKIDRRRADDTSEEEDEENFIKDESTNGSSSVFSEDADASRENTPESDLAIDRAVTPPQSANGARSYLTSPSATKRKRMEELAKQRKKKKR